MASGAMSRRSLVSLSGNFLRWLDSSATKMGVYRSPMIPRVVTAVDVKFLYPVGCYLAAKRSTHQDIPLWMTLFASGAFFFGISGSPILSENISSTDMGIESESATGKAYVSGLRKIEDDSVISNIHTSKWRVFTDNARDLYFKGKLDEAEKYFLLALQEAKEGFGESDAHVASACNNLAEFYRIRKAYEKAEPLYLESVGILERSLGPEDVRVAFALHNLGSLYFLQHKLEKARLCYERALKIKGRVLGLGNADYANTLFHLGKVLHLLGDLKDSEALIQDSIRILEEAGQGESITCLRRMQHLVQMLLQSSQFKEAENVQRKILHVLELLKGWDSLDAIAARENLALILQSGGRLNEAEELFERCLKIRKELLSLDHAQLGKGRSAADAQKQYLRSLKGLRSILTRQNTQESEGKLRKVEEEIKRVENEIQSSGRNKK
ncbi:uncharacterized protein LOC116259245 isoform X2 [Nymphaea colorata]|uniref:uncharacterized protein LOC116259245 isoform X2 n=1 Tax=Nymphaea colorata TaxID=210225 RepID=UPI00129E7990|nr:uncharacterized protein LOC116259245 isoform X2 [Nymphaea colorata]